GPRAAVAPAVGLAAQLTAATRVLAEAGGESPRADADLLAAHVLGVSRGRLPLIREIPGEAAERLRALVARRCRRVPLQHLTGEAYFRHRTLAVGPGVFVPRPETETVAGWAIDELRAGARPGGPGLVCVDLCAGSGAIALALADEVPGAEVHAVEADPAALGYLRRNVAAAGLAVGVHAADVLGGAGPVPDGWAEVSVLDALAGLVGRVDAVVSNPPYLPDSDRVTVAPEVGDHDPPWALWGGGGDGLAAPRAVAAVAAALLRPGGLFAMEHADGQGPAARALLVGTRGWSEVATRRDLAGRDRFVTARLEVSADRAEGAIRGKQ
ncbi:peptide chain release factor N(5)-glutamine methyltransferase, partial [Frankia nepalensis]|uniref:peptide chain release factor N(5)-glutamine methyltransferase n=1 Tax=Frankia nepalensis TaxID=1836974 RepID=UPI00396A4F0E